MPLVLAEQHTYSSMCNFHFIEFSALLQAVGILYYSVGCHLRPPTGLLQLADLELVQVW